MSGSLWMTSLERKRPYQELGTHLGKMKNVSGESLYHRRGGLALDITDLIVHSVLSLPRVNKQKPPPGGSATRNDPGRGRRLHNPGAETTVLETHGYLVDTAVDGLDALENRRHPLRPHCQ